MPMLPKEEEIFRMAGDTASIANAKSIAKPTNWQKIGFSKHIAWGICVGSQQSHQVLFDTKEKEGKCTCQRNAYSAKYCKHTIALLLMLAENLHTEEYIPDWVMEWDEARLLKDNTPKRTLSVEKIKEGEDAFIEKALEGIEILENWLEDTLKNGIATLLTNPRGFIEPIAKQMNDYKMQGIAKMMLRLLSIPKNQNEVKAWLEGLGMLHTYIEYFKKIQQFDDLQRTDLISMAGYSYRKDYILSISPYRFGGQWVVVGIKEHQEDNQLRACKTWFWNQKHQQYGFVIEYAQGTTPFPTYFSMGQTIESESIFYPSVVLQRMLLLQPEAHAYTYIFPKGTQNAQETYNEYAHLLTLNPFLDAFPVVIEDVIFVKRAKEYSLIDCFLSKIPLHELFRRQWEMLSFSEGKKFSVFGEWSKKGFLPISIWNERTHINLEDLKTLEGFL